MAKWGLIEAMKIFRKFVWEKSTRAYLPAGIGTGSLVKKVDSDFVQV